MRRWCLLVPFVLVLACQSDRSPGGGTPGTATPNPNANIDAGTSTSTTSTNGPGVARGAFLDELSPSQLAQICAWFEMKQGGAGTYDCGNGVSTTVASAAECAAETNLPHCAAGLVIDCMEALDGDPCRLFSTNACGPYLACASGG